MALNIFTHKTGVVYSSDEGQLVGITNTYTGNEEAGLKQTTGISDTLKQLSIAATTANLVSSMMNCTVAATVQTFLTTVAKDSFSLTAKNLHFWNDTVPGGNPFTSNFDSIKYTTTQVGVLQIRMLSNQP